MAIINLRDYYPFIRQTTLWKYQKMLLKCSRSLTGRKPLTVCVHTGTKPITPWIGMMELSMRRFSLRSLPMNCMSVKWRYKNSIPPSHDCPTTGKAHLRSFHSRLDETRHCPGRGCGWKGRAARHWARPSELGKNFKKIFIRCTDFASKMKWLMRGSQSLGPHWPEAGHASRRLKTE